MTISIAEAILEGAHKLRQAGVPEPRREAGSLLANVIGQDRAFILTHAEDPIAEELAERFRGALERRATGEPFQYITGHQEFFSLDFEVTKAVLIPRPETELLVEAARNLLRGSQNAPFICDVGTGSGCVAIALLHELGEVSEARTVAIDISLAALEVAKRNAALHTVAERIEFVVSDCFSELSSEQALFDLIVSNPPYIEESAFAELQREVRDFEPRTALVAGPDGLSIIRRLLSEAGKFLKTGGHFLFEIGFEQSAAVERLIDPDKWRLLEIHKDLQGIPRVVALQKPG